MNGRKLVVTLEPNTADDAIVALSAALGCMRHVIDVELAPLQPEARASKLLRRLQRKLIESLRDSLK